MGEKITGYDGEVIAEVVDYYDSSGYLGTAIKAEEKGCLELMVLLPFLGMMFYQIILGYINAKM